MAFWGCEVKPGKATPFVPPPEASKLHLSQACLSTKAKPGSKAALRVKVGEEALLVCSLREGATESVGLDLIFDQYTEFSVEGAAPIHLTGYYMPEYEMDHGEDDTDDDDGEFPGGRLLGYDEYGVPIMEGDVDSEDEDSDEEFASDEESDEDEDGDLNPPRRVVIEDVTQEGGKAALQALPAPSANGKAAAFEDADVEGSDDDDEDSEEGSDDEEFESDESESQSEDEEEEARQAAAKQAQQAQQAGQKRKAEAAAAAAKQPPAKAAKQQAAATPAADKKQAAQQAKTPATAPAKQQAQQAAQQQAPATAPAKQQQKEQQKEAGKAAKVRSFPNGFIIEDLKAGRPDGKLAKAGKKVVMRYIGKLKNGGKVFDQTKGNATFSFRLGVGEVIKGWDRGVEGMRVGDKRRLTIPPQMAYGSGGVRGTIPPNATLVFDVELVDVK